MTRRYLADAPLPPLPADPMVCRWCGRTRLTRRDGATFCPSACAPNDRAPFRGDCRTCEREFDTGSRHRVDQCWECEARELAEYRRAFGPPDVDDEDRPGWRYSKRAMQERLSVSGDVDE